MGAGMIKLYGSPMSRAFRCMWMLEELGIPYEHINFDHTKNKLHKTPEYLAMNPNGHVPTFVDGDIIMWESFAINLYLASTYGDGVFFGASEAERAAIYKWTLWGACELEGPADHAKASKLRMLLPHAWLLARYEVAEQTLTRQPYLAANRFTVADLNVMSLLFRPTLASNDVSSLPAVSDWLRRIAARPAYQKIMEQRVYVCGTDRFRPA
jgi:glutathione S-transferase